MAVKIARAKRAMKADCCGRIIKAGEKYRKVTEKGSRVKRYCAGYC
jgi:hypothetical protein